MASSSIPAASMLSGFAASNPLVWVLAISIVIGLLMVIVFRYTSDQKAIGRAKDRLKAHLLAVRLFQDQLPVVMRAYGKILRGTGSYLRLAFTPFLIAILPITFLIVQLDRYFGWLPLQPAQSFLVVARVSDPAALERRCAATASGTIEFRPSGPRSEGQGNSVASRSGARRAIRDQDRNRRSDSFQTSCRFARAGAGFAGSAERQFLGAHVYLGRAGAWRIIVPYNRSRSTILRARSASPGWSGTGLSCFLWSR